MCRDGRCPEIVIYWMHRDDFDSQNYQIINRPQTSVNTILSGLNVNELRSQFTMLGLSNWKTDRIATTQQVARDNNLVRPVANSPYFSLMEMSSTTIHVGGVQVCFFACTYLTFVFSHVKHV